jgi:hypothetical protein
MSLQSSTTVLDYINSDGTAISSEDLNSWIKDSADAIEYAIELDKRKDACTGADATQLHELEDGAKARMETLIDGLASRWAPARTDTFFDALRKDVSEGRSSCGTYRC